MAGLNIITNNDAIVLFFKQYKMPDAPEIKFIDAAVVRVFQTGKEEAKKGARLLANPISSGDAKCESPFKTLIMAGAENEGIIHFESMTMLDSASRAYNKAAKNRFRAYTEDNIREYKAADLQLVMTELQEVLRSMMN